jgi:D-alanyl-D-alanine carboxypeptidase (penicillin-binding protein 5/6)
MNNLSLPLAIKTFFLSVTSFAVALGFWSSSSAPTKAQDLSYNARYAAIVVDAQSGEVLYARRADAKRYPASLTKIMTLYMAFDYISRGDLSLDDTITLSRNAASQPPTKSNLRAGDTLTVEEAMRVISLHSANDLSVALAEKIAGTEERFAALMTMKAQVLGMTKTNFANASGLPDSRQVSTAQEMAILARATLRDFPQYYNYFNQRSYNFRGRVYHNHNPLLSYEGVDGMKTGYTNAAGYNLVASKVEGNHRLITVMLGGNNKAQRRAHVNFLLNTGFDVITRRERGEEIQVAQAFFVNAMQPKLPEQAVPYTILAANSAPPVNPLTPTQSMITDRLNQETGTGPIPYTALSREPEELVPSKPVIDPDDEDLKQALKEALGKHKPDVVTLSDRNKDDTLSKALDRTKKETTTKPKTLSVIKPKKDINALWGIQVGAFKDKSQAQAWNKTIERRFDSVIGDANSLITRTDNGWYRSRFNEMTRQEAQKACQAIDAKRLDCNVIKP